MCVLLDSLFVDFFDLCLCGECDVVFVWLFVDGYL